MADGLYISMAGAAARSENLDSIADNLANAQTPGYKAARPAFESFLPASGSEDKVYPAAVSTGIDRRAGPTTHTGNSLDLLPEDDALFAVRTASGGTAFTRAGHVTVNSQGFLLAAGLPLLDRAGQPIAVPPQSTPTIKTDGTVTADGREVGAIALWKIDGPVGRMGPQLLSPGEGARVGEAQQGRLRVGELELGNYTALEATVQLVGAQRHFETSMQAMQTYRRLDDRVVEIGRVR